MRAASSTLILITALGALLSGCSSDDEPDSGSLTVSVTTEGPNPDPDGYSVTVGDQPAEDIPVNGDITMTGLPEGAYRALLSGIASNCLVDGTNPFPVHVNGGETGAAAFAVTCVTGGVRVKVITQTTGTDLDANGYLVQVGTGTARRMEANSTEGSVIAETLGALPITLTDVASNCTADAGNPTSVTTAAGQEATVTFKVACAINSGSVRVTVTATGSDVQSSGYLLSVDGAATPASTGTTNTLTVDHLAAGNHTVRLVQQTTYATTGLSMNCSVAGTNPQTAAVVINATTEVAFAATCAPLATVAPSVTSTGTAIDADGYALSLTGTTTGSPAYQATVAANGTASAIPVLNGAYRVGVSGLSGNCHLLATTPATVTVTANQSLPINVQCDAARQIAVVRGLNTGAEIGLVNSATGAYTRLTNNIVADSNPAWSPNGSRLAFASQRTGLVDIYLMNPDGTALQRLTTSAAADFQPAWSPDGSRIAFVSARDGNNEIYVMQADGSGQVRITDEGASDTEPVWAPSGDRILFVSTRAANGHPGVYDMAANGTDVRLVKVDASAPSVSPAGDRVVFVNTASDSLPFTITDRAGVNISTIGETVMGNEPVSPAWGPDGRIAFSVATPSGCTRLQCSSLSAVSSDGAGPNFIGTLTDVTEPAWRP